MGNTAIAPKSVRLEDKVLDELEAITYFTRDELHTLSTTFFSVATEVHDEQPEVVEEHQRKRKERDVEDYRFHHVIATGEILPEKVLAKPTSQYGMSLVQFRKLFPPFSQELVDSLFAVMDENGDGSIEFREFALALSIMSRGSIEDKILLSFQLCDFDRTGSIEREEMKKVLDEINFCIKQSTNQGHGGKADSTNLDYLLSTRDIIESLFAKRPTRKTPPSSFAASVNPRSLSASIASASTSSVSSVQSSSAMDSKHRLRPHHRDSDLKRSSEKVSLTSFVKHLSPHYYQPTNSHSHDETEEGEQTPERRPRHRFCYHRRRYRIRRGAKWFWNMIIKCGIFHREVEEMGFDTVLIEEEEGEGNNIDEEIGLDFSEVKDPKLKRAILEHEQSLENHLKVGAVASPSNKNESQNPVEEAREKLNKSGKSKTSSGSGSGGLKKRFGFRTKSSPRGSKSATSPGRGSKSPPLTDRPLATPDDRSLSATPDGSQLELGGSETKGASGSRAVIRQALQEALLEERIETMKREGMVPPVELLYALAELKDEDPDSILEEEPGQELSRRSSLERWYSIVDEAIQRSRSGSQITEPDAESVEAENDKQPEKIEHAFERLVFPSMDSPTILIRKRDLLQEPEKSDPPSSPPLPPLEAVSPQPGHLQRFPSSPSVLGSAGTPPPVPPPRPPVTSHHSPPMQLCPDVNPRIKAAQARIAAARLSDQGLPRNQAERAGKRFLSQSQTVTLPSREQKLDHPPLQQTPSRPQRIRQVPSTASRRWTSLGHKIRNIHSSNVNRCSSASEVSPATQQKHPATLSRSPTTPVKPNEQPQPVGSAPAQGAGPAPVRPHHSSAWSKVLHAVKRRGLAAPSAVRHEESALAKKRPKEVLDSLTLREFLVRTMANSELIAGFDILYEFLSKYLLEPVAVKQHWRDEGSQEIHTKNGPLKKEKASRLHFQRFYAIICEVRHGFFAYYYPGERTPRKVLSLQDSSIKAIDVQEVLREGHKEKNKNQFFVGVLNYRRRFIAPNEEALKEWVKTLRLNASLRKAHLHRHHSFAPVRSRISCQYYVDGKDYFMDLALDGFENAKKHIYIADWWLVPELHMVRNPENPENPFPMEYRLDKILERKAKEGVKIRILLWLETTVAGWYLASARNKSYLESLHPNIKVQLHPWIFPIKWSHHQKAVVIDDVKAYLGGIDLCFGRYDDSTHPLIDDDARMFPGRDFTNYQWNPDTYGDPAISALDRKTQARMPWHDIHVRVEGSAAIDCSYNFVQRWNFALRTGQAPRIKTLGSKANDLYILPDFPVVEDKGTCDCQILRSVAYWSAGVYTESSIYKAYLDCIRKANHCIYIENQFFISRVDDEGTPKNSIAKAIFDRIALAIKREETFRVIVVLPISPGGIEDPTTRYLMKLTFRTISRGGNSLLEKIAELTPRPFDYISFHVLRNWNVLSNGNLVSEQIYVHSKLMIVDDQIVICGSANINDRSMRGTRDSEIAALIEDRNYVDSMMNGKPYKAGAFAFNLRRKLWQQHLGLCDDELHLVTDPNHPSVYRDLWQATSRHNSQILSKVFPSSILNPRTGIKESASTKGAFSPTTTVMEVPEEEPNETQTHVQPAVITPDSGTGELVKKSAVSDSEPAQPVTSEEAEQRLEGVSPSSSSNSTAPIASSPSTSTPSPDSGKPLRASESALEMARARLSGSGSSAGSEQSSSPGGGSRGAGSSTPKTPEEQEEQQKAIDELLDLLGKIKGFLNDYPLDLFLGEDLDPGLGLDIFVPKNVFF